MLSFANEMEFERWVNGIKLAKFRKKLLNVSDGLRKEVGGSKVSGDGN